MFATQNQQREKSLAAQQFELEIPLPSVGSIPGLGRFLENGMAIHSSGESHGQRSLASYSPWGHTQSDTTEATWHTCTIL